MRRHLLIGTLGRQDNTPIPSAPDEIVTQFPLEIKTALQDLKRLQIFPSEIGVDLITLAAHVHAADTRISRFTESQDTWTREFRLVVPVSAPPLWTATSDLLSRMLNFLTGDKWDIGFRPRPTGFSTIVPRRSKTLIAPPFDSISLFSGGLDSLIGAIDALEAGQVPLLVSHAGEGATSDAQQQCFDTLKSHYRTNSFDRLRLWLNFSKSLVRDVESENTTRGRSFLFFALGIFAGTGINQPFVLKVPENGLIALNIPLDMVRLGALSTRTTHPFYMARWNELLSLLGINGRVENPYWDKTKGEMVAACGNQRLLIDIIPASLSCSSPTKGRWQGRAIEHCGYCLPCLIRKAALQHALGLGNDPTTYSIDNLNAQVLDTLRAEGQQIRSFQLAIQRLGQNPELARILIHKSGSLADQPQNLAGLADVYRRGMNEVAALLSGVRAIPS
ncbi:MAG: hypothetical protein K2Q17_07855 [Nitrospiraceae bacterium]|nr:hypothetical protein [Nitrospiraceae bacterium]